MLRKLLTYGMVLVLISSIVMTSSCSKTSTKEVEEGVKFEYDALDANICNGDKFVFTVKLLSAMPSSGVKLEVGAKEELSGTVLSQDASIISKGIQTALSVKNLPQQKWVVVTVSVCSAKNANNCITKTFRVVFK